MSTSKFAAIVGMALSAVVAAQGTTPDAKGTVQSPGTADVMPGMPGTDTKAKGKLSNGEFIEKAAMAGLAEIRISNLALDKSQTPAIREFANRMVKEHTAANQRLKGAARASGVTLPQNIDPAHTELLQQLKSKSGRDFDAAYVNVMKQDHDSAIALFENAAGDVGLSKELRDYAIEMLDTLRSHQLLAHNLPGASSTGDPGH